MFFILSKTVGLLLNPMLILLILLMLGLLFKKPLLKGIFLSLFFFLFIIFSNPVITNEVMQWWEVPPVPYKQLEKPYQAAIVLSGVTASDKGPYDRVHLYKGADRVMHAVQLYKLGKVENLVLSGGSGSLEADSVSEAERMKRVMVLSGVPDSAIILEEKSRNTHENALFSKQLVDSAFTDGRFLLVTSAFHMRRAQACFAQEGLAAVPFTTDFYSSDKPYKPEDFLIPQADAISSWGKLLREWLGLFMYKISGYV